MAEKDDRMVFKPLETNPESINEYLFHLGLDPSYAVSELYGFTPDLLDFVLRPVYALIFLFPVDGEGIEQSFSLLDEPEEERERKDLELSKDMYLIHQTIKNACGTIALIHAIGNSRQHVELKDDSVLKQFLDSTLDKTPIERGKILEGNEAMASAHEECAESGETSCPEDTSCHFIALVEHRGYLWKCDGSSEKKAIRVNITNRNNILENAAEYCTKFMEMNPKILKFAALALHKI